MGGGRAAIAVAALQARAAPPQVVERPPYRQRSSMDTGASVIAECHCWWASRHWLWFGDVSKGAKVLE